MGPNGSPCWMVFKGHTQNNKTGVARLGLALQVVFLFFGGGASWKALSGAPHHQQWLPNGRKIAKEGSHNKPFDNHDGGKSSQVCQNPKEFKKNQQVCLTSVDGNQKVQKPLTT